MGILVLIVIGSAMGGLVSVMTAAESHGRILGNMVAGIGGAFFAVLLTNPYLGGGDFLRGEYTLFSIIAAFGGATALLGLTVMLRSDRSGSGTVSPEGD